ncbi:B-cell receptor-associated protein 31-like-domain-containing protein [Flammula alnicola]|nr:B-cell receptor-associated protein 31-like-domain-containing protein [Flammula alnicola]KAF8968862.1 B-cell receptor-associated protein 31-like-domain-containing protein [Flammula alnicola]
MTIYYSLTFMLLAAEMITFCALVAPLPYVLKKRLFQFLSESKIVAKIAYGLKISFIFVAILFADALQRMFRVTAESDLAKSNKQGMVSDIRTDTGIAARKFYAQRNVYLTGFCLFLSLVLTRTFYIILDLIHTQEEYAKLKKATTSSSRTNGGQSEDQAKEIVTLKKQLEEAKKQQRDFEILKKQAAQNNSEYDRLATELNDLTGNKSNKRVD